MFYVNTTTRKFASSCISDSFQEQYGCCCNAAQVPLFLRTKVIPPSPVQKPTLTNFQTTVLKFQFKDSQGLPYDLTGASLVLVVDNTFSHSDSLICLSSQCTITDPANGIAQFVVNCSSVKFGKMVAAKLPSTEIWMQITAYTQDILQGTVLLQDKGISLRPRLYGIQGVPEDGDPNYYNKQQINVMIGGIIASDSAAQQDLFTIFQEHFYNKEQVDSFVQALSNSISLLKEDFDNKLHNYYTKSDIDDITSRISDSLQSIRSTFDNYYTKQQTDNIVGALSDSFNGKLLNYYTKGEIDGITESISDSLQALKQKFNGYYTKGQVDSIADSLSDAFDTKLLNYYNKQQIDNTVEQLSDSLRNIRNTFSDYYKRPQVDSIISSLSDSFNGKLRNYYTKGEVDVIAAGISDSLLHIRQSLDNYYTKTQVDAALKEVSDSLAATNSRFDSYYTKDQVNALIQGISNSVDLSDYYTKEQTDALIKSLSDSITAVNNRLAQITIKKDIIPQQGFAATYRLIDWNGNVKGDPINIIQDSFLQDAKLIQSATQQDKDIDPSVIIGQPYLKLIFYTQQDESQTTTIVYVSLSFLKDVYKAGNGLSLVDGYFNIKLSSDSYTASHLSVSQNGLSLQLGDYYTKAQIDPIVADLSNSIHALDNKFSSYYTKEEVDATVKDLSDSIQSLNQKFDDYYTKEEVDVIIQSISNSVDLSDYYTKQEVDVIASALSDSIIHIKGQFDNYYDKEQVDLALKQISDSISVLYSNFQNYYDKAYVDALQSALSNSIASVKSSVELLAQSKMDKSDALVIQEHLQSQIDNKLSAPASGAIGQFLQKTSDSAQWADVDFSQYYTKAQIDQLFIQFSDSVDLSNYYNKGEVDQKLSSYVSDSTFNNQIELLSQQIQTKESASDAQASYQALQQSITTLSDSIAYIKQTHYTKAQVDSLIQGISNSVDLSNYYTKGQVNGFITALSNSIEGLQQKFNGYYTKSEVDSLIQSISNSVDLSDYYTKQQVDTLIQSISNSVDLSDYYTKQEVDQLLQSGDASYITIQQVSQNKIVIHELKIPIGVQTDKGSYYPIEKSSLQIDSNSVVIDISPYLAYDGSGSFQPPWRVYLSSANIQNLLVDTSDSVFNAFVNNMQQYYQQLQQELLHKLDKPSSGNAGQFLQKTSDSTQWADIDLGNYYTKSEVDAIVADLSNSIDLSNYYTKGQVDSLIQSISNSVDLSNYYTKGQVDTLIQEISNSVDLSNYYTKEEVDDLYGVSDASFISISSVTNNKAHLPGIKLPLGIQTDKGTYYPIEKTSLQIGSNSVVLDITPYLVYDGSASFQPVWKAWFGKSVSLADKGIGIVQETTPFVSPEDGAVYVYQLQQSDSITIDNSTFTSDYQVTFQLHLKQPSSAVSFTLPADVLWGDGSQFKTSNQPPDMSAANASYCLVFRWDGEDLLGNLAYAKLIQSDSGSN